MINQNSHNTTTAMQMTATNTSNSGTTSTGVSKVSSPTLKFKPVSSSSLPNPAANFRGGFPWKLHQLLDDAAKGSCSSKDIVGNKSGVPNESIVSWLPNGRAFKIHDRINFVAKVMPIYFKTANYKSFHRSLNLWGFETVRQGVDRGAIYHPYFVRDDPNQCNYMKRIKNKRDSNNVNNGGAASAGLHAASTRGLGGGTGSSTSTTPSLTSTVPTVPAPGGAAATNKGYAAALSLNSLKTDGSQMMPLIPSFAGNLAFQQQQQQKSAILRHFILSQMENEMAAAAAARQFAAAAASAASAPGPTAATATTNAPSNTSTASTTSSATSINSIMLQEVQRQISLQALLNNSNSRNPTAGNLVGLLGNPPPSTAPPAPAPLSTLAALLGTNRDGGASSSAPSAATATATSSTANATAAALAPAPATVAEALAILSASSSKVTTGAK